MTKGGQGRAYALALAMLAAAFLYGHGKVEDLAWPNEHDLYRDMASAQSMLDEGLGRDPCYLGERVWYNPLTAQLMAVAHRVTGLTLPEVAARGGAYLNLAAPIAFFAMVAVLFDAWTAVFALGGFLFCVGGSFPSWAAATYSPWLYPVNVAQAFFYLLILRAAALWHAPVSIRWSLGTGVLLGVAFLAHTAPVLIFACVLAWVLLAPCLLREQPWLPACRSMVAPGLVMAAAFAVITLPFTWSIVGHYGLRIVNDIPNGYVPDFLGYRHIPDMVLRHLDVPVLVAWVGLYGVARGRHGALARRILLPWVAVSAAGLFYAYVVVGAAKVGVRLPIVLPGYHSLFYFKAALSVLFALGLVTLARGIVARFGSAGRSDCTPWERGGALLLLAAIIAWSLPAYGRRYDFTVARSEALGHAAERGRIAIYTWLRDYGKPDDVVVASDNMGLFAVAPAGAKVVVVNPYFSNPYVDWAVREQARSNLCAALERGDGTAFLQLADTWHVTYVAEEPPHVRVSPALVGRDLQPVLSSGGAVLYRVLRP